MSFQAFCRQNRVSLAEREALATYLLARRILRCRKLLMALLRLD